MCFSASNAVVFAVQNTCSVHVDLNIHVCFLHTHIRPRVLAFEASMFSRSGSLFSRWDGSCGDITWSGAIIKPWDRWWQKVGRIQRWHTIALPPSLSLSPLSPSPSPSLSPHLSLPLSRSCSPLAYTYWILHCLDLSSLSLIFSTPTQLFINLFLHLFQSIFPSLSHTYIFL